MRFDQEHVEFAERDWQELTDADPIRIAVVGLGRFATNRALPAIREAGLCETTVVVSWTAEEARPVAREFDVPWAMGYDQFRDGMATEKYDAVYIATPNAFHLPYIRASAEHGKDILCEKPLDISVERAEQAVEMCRDAGVTLMVGYRMQFEPTLRRMREYIDDGYVGDVIQLSATFSNRIPPDQLEDEWRLDEEIAGGGALIDLGIYPLNTMRFLLGEDPVSVFGTTASPHTGFEMVDEHVSFELSFPNDVLGSCIASLNAYSTSRLVVQGTDGEIQVASPFGGIVPHSIVAERDDMRTEYTGSPVNEVIEEFDYFAHCLLTDTTPEPDGEDGLVDLRVIEAVYEAANTHCRVIL